MGIGRFASQQRFVPYASNLPSGRNPHCPPPKRRTLTPLAAMKILRAPLRPPKPSDIEFLDDLGPKKCQRLEGKSRLRIRVPVAPAPPRLACGLDLGKSPRGPWPRAESTTWVVRDLISVGMLVYYCIGCHVACSCFRASRWAVWSLGLRLFSDGMGLARRLWMRLRTFDKSSILVSTVCGPDRHLSEQTHCMYQPFTSSSEYGPWTPGKSVVQHSLFTVRLRLSSPGRTFQVAET